MIHRLASTPAGRAVIHRGHAEGDRRASASRQEAVGDHAQRGAHVALTEEGQTLISACTRAGRRSVNPIRPIKAMSVGADFNEKVASLAIDRP